MRKRNRTQFDESALKNNMSYAYYFKRLKALAISVYEWKNLPPSIDERFLEKMLFEYGKILFFKDENIDELICLPFLNSKGQFDIYENPTTRQAYSPYTGYRNILTETDSVICYNNVLRENSISATQMFAERLAEIDRTIDVNIKAQKTPILIVCKDTLRLSAKNLYKEYDGNSPIIFGAPELDEIGVKVLKTDAPFISQNLYDLKTNYWNEALSFYGISNVSFDKKERLLVDEVNRAQGAISTSRYSPLEMRKKCCKELNEMFGTNIECDFRQDFQNNSKHLYDEGTKQDPEEGDENE